MSNAAFATTGTPHACNGRSWRQWLARAQRSGRAPNTLDALPDDVRLRVKVSGQPKWVAPMLATLTEERFSREGWLFEQKFDGERCLAFGMGRSGLHLLSRNRKLLNDRYPELVDALGHQTAQIFIADGEIVTFKDGVSSFSMLQKRMQVVHPSAALRREVPVSFYLFDLLYIDRYDIRRVPLQYRKELLRRAVDFGDHLCFTKHREKEGEGYYREACRRGWEGIVAKDETSEYVSKRTRAWLKFKCVHEQEFIVVGYTDPRGGRLGFGALLLGYHDRGNLVYAGKVGTGFDDATLRRLGRRLRELESTTPPFEADGLPRREVHWVKPILIAEVAFTEWTPDGKLRHPRFVGLRDDKSPKEIVNEG